LAQITHRYFCAKGNPKSIGSLSDLTRSDITFVNRQRGAGTRILLDHLLRKAGIEPDQIQGYDIEVYTHMGVAAAVKSGSVDAGLGIRAAAQALELDFIAIEEERYDLCIPAEFWETPYIQRLLAVMAESAFHEEVKKLGGYDLRDCGRVMWKS
jgi:putative molybdopterin biosynthesis protein